MKNLSELRALSLPELNEELLNLRTQQFTLRTKKAYDNLKQTHQLSVVKKVVAQIKTIISEKGGKGNGD